MAAPVVKLKRSSVPGRVPLTSDLALGELAINTFDGKAYFKKDNGTESIVEVGTGAGGGGSGGSYTAPLLLALYNKNNSGDPASFNGTETRFQLRNAANGNVISAESALLVSVSVDGVIQKPNSEIPAGTFEGFYITANSSTGSDIVFGAAPSAGASFFGLKAGTFAATSGTTGITKLDDISSQFNGTLTSFTLKKNNAAYAPEYTNALLITVGGVVQIPNTAYTISGATITFTSAPPTGSSFYGIDFAIGESSGAAATTIMQNKIQITSNTVVESGYNGLSVGPIEVAATYSVEVPAGSTWVIL